MLQYALETDRIWESTLPKYLRSEKENCSNFQANEKQRQEEISRQENELLDSVQSKAQLTQRDIDRLIRIHEAEMDEYERQMKAQRREMNAKLEERLEQRRIVSSDTFSSQKTFLLFILRHFLFNYLEPNFIFESQWKGAIGHLIPAGTNPLPRGKCSFSLKLTILTLENHYLLLSPKLQTQSTKHMHHHQVICFRFAQRAEEEQAASAAESVALKEQQDATIKRVLESQLELDEEWVWFCVKQ